MKLLRLALIGAGNRCTALYKADLKKRSDVEIVAVCDTCSEKSEKLASLIEADGRVRPSAYEDYRRCLGEEKPDWSLGRSRAGFPVGFPEGNGRVGTENV